MAPVVLLGFILLCIANAANAKKRSKSRVIAVVYTLALWYGFSFLGQIISALMGMNNLSFVAILLIFSVIGGVISNRISKLGEIVDAQEDVDERPGYFQQPEAHSQDEPTAPQSAGFCSFCGAQLAEVAKFCMKCGKPVRHLIDEDSQYEVKE